MIRITVGTATNRKTVSVDIQDSAAKVVAENGGPFNGRPYFNGMPISAEEMEMTLEELGAAEEGNTLIFVTDKNAGFTAKTDGSTLKVISVLSPDQIRTLVEDPNDHLVLKDIDPDGNVIEKFRIGLAKDGPGEMNGFSIAFSPQATLQGKAKVTVELPENVEDPRRYCAVKYGPVLKFLGHVEGQAEEWLEFVRSSLESAMEMIQLCDE